MYSYISYTTVSHPFLHGELQIRTVTRLLAVTRSSELLSFVVVGFMSNKNVVYFTRINRTLLFR
jgi:hypothetical protein